jgi:hypothetical protein
MIAIHRDVSVDEFVLDQSNHEPAALQQNISGQ